MGDGTPDPVALVVDAQDPHGDPAAPGRAATLGVGAEAVDPVQRNEYAGSVHHTDGADIPVAHRVFLQSLLIGVFSRLLDGGGDMELVRSTPSTFTSTRWPGW